MLTNADITIYSKTYDTATRLDKWFRTQIKGVSWFGRFESTLATTGMLNADVFQIRIPINADFMGRTYVDPLAWATLTELERAVSWTIQKDDIVVKGLVTDEITTAFTIAKLQAKYKNSNGKIVSVHDNRCGSLPIQHWAVVAQ